MNGRTGEISENVELENLDDDETDHFKNEWRQRSSQMGFLRHPEQHFAHPPMPSHRLQHRSTGSHPAPSLALEHHPSAKSFHRSHEKPSKYEPSLSHRSHFRPAHTIDLTEDAPSNKDIEEINMLSSSAKRKAPSASSKDVRTQRRHRQNRLWKQDEPFSYHRSVHLGVSFFFSIR